MKYFKCLVFSNPIAIVIKVILHTEEFIPLLMTGWENGEIFSLRMTLPTQLKGGNVKNPHICHLYL